MIAAQVRGLVEIKLFFGQRESVVFTFALPIILLLLFGEIFHGKIAHTGVDFRQYFIAGIVASGLVSATFVNLGVGTAADRDDGTLTRLAGTPLSPVSYFAGKAIVAFVVCVLEVAALLAFGAATCSLLGIAVSCAVKATTRSAVAVMNLPYLVLSFISGVYFVFSDLPAGCERYLLKDTLRADLVQAIRQCQELKRRDESDTNGGCPGLLGDM